MKVKFIIASFLFFLSVDLFAVSKAKAEDFCKQWFPALVRGEQNTDEVVKNLLRDFYTEDSVLIDPNFSKQLTTYQERFNYYFAVLDKYPNWKFEIIDIFPTETGFILHYQGSVPELVPFFRGVDIIDLTEVDGKLKIKKLVGVYDRTPFIEAEKNE